MTTMEDDGPFRAVPWPEIAHELGRIGPSVQPIVDIVGSVMSSGAAARLAGLTSMADLVVVPAPLPPPPYDKVIVRLRQDFVTVETWDHAGRIDKIGRPAYQAVPLFWRIMIAKFGVHPTPTGAPPDRAP
jgi:hypothetical protein